MENQDQQDLNVGPQADELDIGENPIVDIGVSLLMYFWQNAIGLRNRLRGGLMITRSMLRKIYRDQAIDDQHYRRRIDPQNPRHVSVDMDYDVERPYTIPIETRDQTIAREIRKNRNRAFKTAGITTVAAMALRYKLGGKTYGPRLRGNPPPPPPPQYEDFKLPNQFRFANNYLGPVPAQPAQRVIQIENNMNRGGGAMLTWKNRLTRRYTTHCDYFMGPQIVGITDTDKNGLYFYRHRTDYGSGPSLYTLYDNSLPNTATRNLTLGTPLAIDGGTDDNNVKAGQQGIGQNTIIYCFAADWPFITMNHDPRTQPEARIFIEGEDDEEVTYDNRELGSFFKWKYHGYDPLLTDNNIPIQLSYFLKNKDWTYITHYSTTYNFDITNLSTQPHVVEILFFTFKADPDAMDYGRQIRAPLNRQDLNMDNYINNFQQYPEDINIQYRKRIYLPGMENNFYSGGWRSSPNSVRENNTTWSYKVKRKYVMKRPILKLNAEGNIDDMTEDEFFNTYYEPQKGVYCRIQAWPMESNFMVDAQATPPNLLITTGPDKYKWPIITLAALDPLCNGTQLMNGVTVKMSKKSKIKLDEPIYKGGS